MIASGDRDRALQPRTPEHGHVEELHTNHLVVLCQFGSMPSALARQNTELFAKAVAPHVRPLYHEWEDRWWPQALVQTAQSGST